MGNDDDMEPVDEFITRLNEAVSYCHENERHGLSVRLEISHHGITVVASDMKRRAKDTVTYLEIKRSRTNPILLSIAKAVTLLNRVPTD